MDVCPSTKWQKELQLSWRCLPESCMATDPQIQEIGILQLFLGHFCLLVTVVKKMKCSISSQLGTMVQFHVWQTLTFVGQC